MQRIILHKRPIACLNIVYKLYTSCLNIFLQNHCEVNEIITSEQAGGKRSLWGCTEQLLINTSISIEVRRKKRNLLTVWRDYRKAFDSVPHNWIIKALQLAKVQKNLVESIKRLTKQWATILNLHGEDQSVTSDEIHYAKGIFQGDSLSVLLFFLSVNPLSFMLGQLKGYSFGDDRKSKVTHNFIDDLKLFASNEIDIKKLLDLVTTFSRDIYMDFGIDKCAYMKVVKGKQVSNMQPLEMNDIVIQPIGEGDTCKYLGQNGNINFDAPINKERVTKEYFTRVRKIWTSELSAYNKVIAHNSFALPVLVPTFGILDWSIQDIKDLDIKTRKQLTMSGNFHPNSDIDLLYIQRNLVGRGLQQIQRVFK